ncbi:TPA: xanthine dehydrogenase family protein subunit M [Candidatus Poribacteria bacterium]|nr:xanthine dehydrogenase family protein subunit M [Candidatus Poribacteria bacterium]
MKNFAYVNATSLEKAPSLLAEDWDEALIIAGGTDLLGELKEYIRSPQRLVNLKTIPNLDYIEYDERGLRIGALTKISKLETDPTVQYMFPALSQAAASVGTPQIRNMGTLGGNLCQRPRCWYYRGEYFNDCLRRGGYLCYAVAGNNKYHGIFGVGPCYIVHPSDTAPALVALGAKVKIVGPEGERIISLEEFFVLPKENVTRENILQPYEVVAEVQIPDQPYGTKSLYLKVQEKPSMDFALASVAAVITMDGNTCRKANLLLGGVAPIPWRVEDAEGELSGKNITEDLAQRAAEASVQNATPLSQNAYKVTLVKALVKRAIMATAG